MLGKMTKLNAVNFLMLKNESKLHGASCGATDIVGTARLWALRISLPDGAA